MARMSLDTAIRLSAEVKGGANITKVQRSLQDLAKGSQTTARDMDALRTATAHYARASEGSIAGIRNSIVAFRGLQEQAKIGSREFKQYGSEVQRLEGKLRGLEGAARRANPALDGIGAAAGRLIAAYAGIETVRFVFGKTAEIEAQTRSLEVLTGSADRAKQIVQELQQLGAVTPFTSAELIDTAKRLQAFGVEAENVVDITRRLADVSGATGAELAGLATAYGQVQAKGRLQGEELLQFQERGVALQQLLREEYGLSGAEFQKALEGGKISAEAVEFALKKLTDSGGKYANGAIAQSDTLNGRLSTLQDSIQMLAQAVGSALTPTFKGFLNFAIAGVSELQHVLKAIQLTAFDTRDWINEAMNFGDRFGLGAGYQAYAQRRQSVATARAALLTGQNPGGDQQSTRPPAARNRPSNAPPPLSGAGAAAGGAGSSSAKAAQLIEHLHGDPNRSGYDRAGHGTQSNAHDHFGFSSEAATRYVMKELQAAGITTTRFGVKSGHSRNSMHYRNQAFDVPWAQFGSGPIGERDFKQSRRVESLVKDALARFNGSTTGGDGGENMREMARQEELDRQKQAKAREDGLRSSSRTAAITKMNLDISRATTEEAKLQANSDRERAERMYKFSAQLAEAKSTEEQINLMKQQGLEIQSAQLDMDREQLEYGKKLNDALLQRVGLSGELLDQSRFTGTGAGARVQTFDLKGTLADTSAAEEKIDRLEQAAESSSQAIGGLFRDIISGTATAEESLSRMFQSIADSFASMVSDMIAEWAKAQIIGLFTKAVNPVVGGGGGFGPTSGDLFGQGLGVKGSLLGFAGGGYTGSSPRAGGIDGQGGFPAILHPQETVIDHTRMMPVPYQKGAGATATSEQIVPYQAAAGAAGNGLTVPFQSGGTALAVPFLKGGVTGAVGDGMAASIDVKFETVRIGEMDFVTRDEAQRIGRESAQRGAELASKRYRNNPDARRRDGIR
jgi:tape measure domain-containing protein